MDNFTTITSALVWRLANGFGIRCRSHYVTGDLQPVVMVLVHANYRSLCANFLGATESNGGMVVSYYGLLSCFSFRGCPSYNQ